MGIGRREVGTEKESTRAALPLAIALAAHVVIAVLLLRVRSIPPPVASAAAVETSPEEAENLFVEVDDFPGRASPVTAAATNEGRAAGSATVAARSTGGSRGAEATVATTLPRAAGVEEGEAAPAGPAPGGALTFEAPHMADLGLVGTNRFLPRSEAQTDAFAQKHATDEILRDKPRDRALGLGPEGPVLAALADGTARSLAPVKGSAIFVATANASGEVVSIMLDETVGERTGWAEAGRLALDGLKGTRLRMPANAQRSVMKLEVVSTWKLPGGHDPGLGVSIFTIPIHRGEGKSSQQLKLLDIVHPATIQLAPGVQVRGVMVSMDLLTVEADPVDVVAKARRVIHTRVLDTTTM